MTERPGSSGSPDDEGTRPVPEVPHPGAESGPSSYDAPPTSGYETSEYGYGQPQYGYGQPEYGYGGHGGYGVAPRTNGKATGALVSGIVILLFSLCCGFGLLGLVPLVLGVKARSEIRASHGTETGDGLALTGIVTGVLAVLAGIASIAFLVIVVTSGNAGLDGYGQGNL